MNARDTELKRHLKSALILFGICLPVFEVMVLSQLFDAYSLIMHGEMSGWRKVFGYSGDIAKILVLTAFTAALLVHKQLLEYARKLVNIFDIGRFGRRGVPHAMAFGAVIMLTGKIYADPGAAQSLAPGWYALWLLSLIATFISWALLFLPGRVLTGTVYRQKWVLGTAFGISLSIWALAMFTRQFWGPMSELTFILSAFFLQTLYPDLVYVNSDEKLLGLGEFIVNIAPACSGYEGVGLVTAFTALYLWISRSALRFPRALLLFPIGAISIWLLNIVRITVLIMIGHHGSPDVAVGGFHSQAGWLTFIFTSLVILWLASDSQFFMKEKRPRIPESRSPDRLPASADHAAIPSLVPMLALLGMTLLTMAFSGGFDWLYPLRVVAVLIALKLYWTALPLLPYRWSALPLIAGAAMAVIWIFMLGRDHEADTAISTTLAAAPVWASAGWLVCRFIGATITVPIAEELAFRGYILCRLSGTEVRLRGVLPFSLAGVVVSSVAFGALHGAWLAGTVAGLVYAVVRLRSDSVTDAIVAHAVTNTLIFGYAAATGVWSVI